MFNEQEINTAVREGWITKKEHPSLSLWILNYTPQTQYEQHWTELTMWSRGLVIDANYNVVAWPFKKFFNIEENKFTPTDEFEVFDKMDGSLFIAFNYMGELVTATRGSFNSDQANKGREILLNKCPGFNPVNSTWLFEVIYPENRIVVDYGNKEDVVLLGITILDGKEVSYNSLIDLGSQHFNVVARHNVNDFTTLKQLDTPNSEGFVVKFSNGDRVKIKFDEYVRLHKILTNVNTVSIWEHLSLYGNVNSLINDIPDEFYLKISKYAKELFDKFITIKKEVIETYKAINTPNRKKYAEHAKTVPHLTSMLFCMYDHKDDKVDELIWKSIRPEYKKL